MHDLRVSRAVCTPHMVALGTASFSAHEQNFGPSGFLALTAHSPNPLSDLFVHQFLLTVGPVWPPDYDRRGRPWAPVRSDHGISQPFLQDISLPVSARGLFRLIPLGRIPRALAAETVAALLAEAGRIEITAALVTLPVDPHA